MWHTKWRSKIWRLGWRGGARVAFLAGSEFAGDFNDNLEGAVGSAEMVLEEWLAEFLGALTSSTR